MSNESLYTNGNLCSVVVFALIIRWSVSLHPYSGQNSPPMYGDYEAQRHWMEITVNLPTEEWYFNTSNNDLMYWGLDYPPLTAYHSYLNGKIAHLINPDFVKLLSSRGYESYNHKFFMRSTVIVSDIVIYFTSVLLFHSYIYKLSPKTSQPKHGEVPEKSVRSNSKIPPPIVSFLPQVGIVLLYPGLIMIDHGHFQYNCIPLGLTISAVAVLLKNRFIIATIFFCLAINYKQMSLYHSLPFFVYMLSHCLPSKTQSFLGGLKRLICISLTVVLVFWLVWFPFLKSREITLQVLHRLFPLARGIFEDKVSNVWCAVNIFYKLNRSFSQIQMAKICIACVFLFSIPSLFNLFKYPTMNKFILSLINVSLSFFLFSYQVHEKSILLVATPVLLYFLFDPFPCFWFLLISNFSMLPLYLKDDLIIPFISLSALFSLFVFASATFPVNSKASNRLIRKYFGRTSNLVKLLFKLSMMGCVILFLCSSIANPPVRYPDLWPLLVSVYSCFHFCIFFLYFNYVQLYDS